MPHSMDVEGENNPESQSTYECLSCGKIIKATTHPTTCECGDEFHNRAKSLE